MKIIDLFAGCGGLSLGFEQNGHKIIKAVEFDPDIAATYKKNHPNVQIFVKNITEINVSKTFKKHEAAIVVGGPPCQGFSMAGARIRKTFTDDPRNYLFKNYIEIVKTVQPDFFVFENVKGIKTLKNGKIFKQIISTFNNSKIMGRKYYTFTKIFKAREFGIPQSRERMIIIGTIYKDVNFDLCFDKTKENIKNKYHHFFDDVNIRDSIGNLPNTTQNGIVLNPKPKTNYQKYLATKNKYLYNHCSSAHSIKSINRMEHIKQGQNFTSLKENIKSVHSGSYGRLHWKFVSPTITTRFDTPSAGRFIHPIQNRTLTPREAARIQSFPDSFNFVGSRSSICKQIGNAVPPKISFFLSCLLDAIVQGAKKC